MPTPPRPRSSPAQLKRPTDPLGGLLGFGVQLLARKTVLDALELALNDQRADGVLAVVGRALYEDHASEPDWDGLKPGDQKKWRDRAYKAVAALRGVFRAGRT